jgi:hypothetical protein
MTSSSSARPARGRPCARGWGTGSRARGLKLNETKTQLVNRREGFDFLGFGVRWPRSRRTGREYPPVEPSPRSPQRLREAVRAKRNPWTLWPRLPEAVAGVNRLLRGWAGYFHFGHSRRVMGKLDGPVRDRVRRWLWRKQGRRKALWSAYPDERLRAQYGLGPLPVRVAWRGA